MGNWPSLDHHGKLRGIIGCSWVLVGVKVDFDGGDLFSSLSKLSCEFVFDDGSPMRNQMCDGPPEKGKRQSSMAGTVARRK